MKLYEFQAKEIFKKAGVPVPNAGVAETVEESKDIAKDVGPPCAIKAQVLVGGRGKAGGIKFADTVNETEEKVESLLGTRLKGEEVERVLIEERLKIDEEYYVGFTVDRAIGKFVSIVSSLGGVEIEEVSTKTPKKIASENLDPLLGFQKFKVRELAYDVGIKKEAVGELLRIAKNLYNLFVRYDALLAEINPLILTVNGDLVAGDAVMNVDDNALYRHPELEKIVDDRMGEDPIMRRAYEYGFDYVKLDGNIGIIGNGAGMTMATMDLVDRFGGSPANFLDVGGGASASRVKNGVEVTFSDPNVDVLLINIFAGITRCDEVAEGVNEAIKGGELPKPIVLRLTGTREEEGLKILDKRIETAKTLEEAVKEAVKLAGR